MIQFVPGQKEAGLRGKKLPTLKCTMCGQKEEIDPVGLEAKSFATPTEYGRWRVQVFTDKHLDCCI